MEIRVGKYIPIILSLFLLCSCSSSLHDCHVVGKASEPSHVQIVLMPKSGGGVYPVPMVHPEKFYLTIEGRDEKGRVKKKVISVSKETYEKYEGGDEWKSE